jgi:hypothetical protein
VADQTPRRVQNQLPRFRVYATLAVENLAHGCDGHIGALRDLPNGCHNRFSFFFCVVSLCSTIYMLNVTPMKSNTFNMLSRSFGVCFWRSRRKIKSKYKKILYKRISDAV